MSSLLAGAVAIHAQPSQQQGLFDPLAIHLYWRQDPTTTMLIDFQTADGARPTVVQYREIGQEEWNSASGETHPFPFSSRIIHRVELTGLQPDTAYDFRFGDDSEAYKFRTMPTSTTRPIRFAAGGDVRGTATWMEKTNRATLPYDPDFVVWGGDLAYADGVEEKLQRWYEWYDAIKNGLITEEGRVIPAVVGIGNHEVRSGYHTAHADYVQTDAFRASIAPYFYGLFAFPGQPGYGVLDFGDYMSIILLDTDHSNPIDGAQSDWLENVLVARQDRPHIVPVYHVPAYPSVRTFSGSVSNRVRTRFVPLFEEYGVRLALEHHDHAYKRTPPIKEGKIDPNGIVYLGDGAWGVSTRTVQEVSETWYLERAESIRHFILVTIEGDTRSLLMVDENGNVFDQYPEPTQIDSGVWILFGM